MFYASPGHQSLAINKPYKKHMYVTKTPLHWIVKDLFITYMCFCERILDNAAQASVVHAAVYSSVTQVTAEPDLVWTSCNYVIGLSRHSYHYRDLASAAMKAVASELERCCSETVACEEEVWFAGSACNTDGRPFSARLSAGVAAAPL